MGRPKGSKNRYRFKRGAPSLETLAKRRLSLSTKLPIRFWGHVNLSGSGAKNKHGYGMVTIGGRTRLAHRVAWEMIHESIPEGLDCLHSCDNPPCVNPGHLFLGNEKVNVDDMYAKSRQNNVGRRRLNREQIIEIKVALKEGRRPVDLAPVYGVCQQYISQLKTWTPRCWCE